MGKSGRRRPIKSAVQKARRAIPAPNPSTLETKDDGGPTEPSAEPKPATAETSVKTPPSPPPPIKKQQRRDNLPSERRRAQIFLLTGVFVAALIAGFSYQPDDDVLRPLPGNGVILDIPRALINKTGEKKVEHPLVIVQWLESHGEEIPGFGKLPFLDIGLPKKNTTRILIAFGYKIDDILPGSEIKSVAFDLPDNASLDACRSMPGLTCEVGQSNVPEGQGRTKRVVKVFGTTTGMPDGNMKYNCFLIQADLSGIPGMNFTQSRTRTLVRYPTVVLTPNSADNPPGNTEIPPLVVASGVQFNNASTISWSEKPSGSGSPGGVDSPLIVNGKVDDNLMGNRAMWGYPMFDSMPQTLPSIGGTDVGVVQEDQNDLFLAGVWFGIAGGSFVTALQQVIVGWPSRRYWKRLWRRM